MVKEAEKTLNKFSLFSSRGKKEDAADLFQRAGNSYKVAKRWDEAGMAFARAGALHKELGDQHDAAQAFVEAAKCFRKTSHDRAIEILLAEVIPGMLEGGRHVQAAKAYEEIAEMYEEDGDVEHALDYFRQAADLHSSSSSKSAANKCLTKVAFLAAQDEKYDVAIETFEQIAETCLESNLLKFNAKGHLLCAGLCIVAKGDMVLADRAMERYKTLDYSFEASRECKLLVDIIAAYNDYNPEQFTDVVYNYDAVSKLDQWKTTIMLRIKNKLIAASKESVDVS